LVEDETGGEPTGANRFVRSSLRSLAERLGQGSPTTVRRSLRQWWRTRGKRAYPGARKIFIEADAGGSNGYRRRLWKRELQRWANMDGLEITVSHYPTGASKWNPVEHRLFGPISTNWAGQPLRTLDTMLGFIRGTRSRTGLRVTARLNNKSYAAKIRVTDDEMAQINIHSHPTCPQWNYTIKPKLRR
jgi:hypothetical protein